MWSHGGNSGGKHSSQNEIEAVDHFGAVFLEPFNSEGLNGSTKTDDLRVDPGGSLGDRPVGVFFTWSVHDFFDQAL